jgi:O-antigen/teichoic acid export membrane protein
MNKKLAAISQKFSPDLQKVIGNLAWLFTDRILRMGLSLLVGVWVARYLGAEQFGLYNYAIAFVALLTAVATLGLDQIVIRDIVREPLDQEKILGTAFALKLVGGIVAVFLAVGIIAVLRPGDSLTQGLVAVIALSMIFQSSDVIDFWFQSQVQSKYSIWAKNAALIATSLGKVLLIQFHASLIWFAWIYSAEFALSAIGLAIVYQSRGHLLIAWKYSLECAIDLLKNSWTLILSSFVILIYMRIDQIMLGQMVGSRAVGVYSVAVRISELWYFVPMAITNSFYPTLIEAKKVSETLYYQRIQKLLGLMSLLSYAVAIVVSLFANQIINLLFGEGYQGAETILIVHIWAGVFVSTGLVRSLWTTTENLMQFAFATTAIGAAVNVVLNYVLIPTYEGIGAAIATVISQAFASYVAGMFFLRTRKFFVAQTKALIAPSFPSLRRSSN